MSRINQPPVPPLPNAGRITKAEAKITTAPRQAAAQPQTRTAAKDGFAAQAAAPMVLNPELQGGPVREVLPQPTQDPKQAPSRDQVKQMVLTAFKQQFNGTKTPTDELLNQWIDKGLEIFNKDGTTQFLTEKLFSELNKAVSAGRTSPLPTQDFKQAPTRDQVKDMVLTAFKQQFNGTKTPTDELLNQWIDKGLEIFNKDGTAQFLTEKLFSELNKAVSAGRTSPLPTQDFKQAPTRDQVKDMVLTAFKQQFNGTKTPTDELLNQWIDKGLEIFNKDGTAQFLTEKLFSELNKAVSAGRTSPLPEQDFKQAPTRDQVKDMVLTAFKQQFNGTKTPTDELLNQWIDKGLEIFNKDGTAQFLTEKLFSELNKAVSAGRTSPLPTQDFKQAPTRDQVKDMVLTAFKQQYNGTKTPTDELLNQWIDKGLEIFNKDGTAQFLTEKLFSELNKAVSAGRTSPMPTEDFKAPVTDDQLKAAVQWAFKQQFNGTHPPSDNELKAWMAEAKKIAEKDGTTQFLQEKVFSALNKAASQG